MSTVRYYGERPTLIDTQTVDCLEMMFYQDYPIKLVNQNVFAYESRLECFSKLINHAKNDFINTYGWEEFEKRNVYLCAKKLYQSAGRPFNREGMHADGFMSDDIGYVWSDMQPTIYNSTKFILSQDDSLSMKEMEEQALAKNDFVFPDNSLVRIDQYNIHRVSDPLSPQIRTFLKITFSPDRYDLKGNSINPLLDYNWDYQERKLNRNIPQSRTDHEEE